MGRAKAGTLDDLTSEVDLLAGLKLQASALKTQLDASIAKVKSLMTSHQIERHVTLEGNEAKLTSTMSNDWLVPEMRSILGEERFAGLCPPTPDKAALRKLFESDPVLIKQKDQCCVQVPGPLVLTVTPAAEMKLPGPKDPPADLWKGAAKGGSSAAGAKKK